MAWAIFSAGCSGWFFSLLATHWIGYLTAGVGRTPDGKTDLAAVSPHTADGAGPTGLVGDRPNRDATPDLPGACELSTADFANLAWPPQGRLRGDLLDGAGNPTTDATKATERFRRVTFGPLETR